MPYPNVHYRIPSTYPNLTYSPMVALPTGEPCEPVSPQYYPYISWFGIPLPDYSFAVEPETKERKIDDVMNRLRQGVESIQNSDIFREFLITMAKFHDYSIGNQILIMIQKPSATQVAGFYTWKDLGRWVKGGEKGIAILAPCFAPSGEARWLRNGTEWAIRRVGDKYGVYLVRSGGMDMVPPTLIQPTYETRRVAERYLYSQGAMRGEERELTPIHFKVVYVFDVSQTAGKELPRVEVPSLSGEVNEDLFTRTMSLAKKDNLTIEFNLRPEMSPEIKGMLVGTTIWVKPDEPRAQQLKTLLHEEAHYYTERVLGIPRADAETIAESSAFVVATHFGFDTGTRSFPYVAIWSKDKKVLEKNLASIRSVSTRMIAGIEGVEGEVSAPSLLKEPANINIEEHEYQSLNPTIYDKNGRIIELTEPKGKTIVDEASRSHLDYLISPPVGLIESLLVTTKRQGIGTALVQYAENDMRKNGVQYIFIVAAEQLGNQAQALPFWKAMGYLPIVTTDVPESFGYMYKEFHLKPVTPEVKEPWQMTKEEYTNERFASLKEVNPIEAERQKANLIRAAESLHDKYVTTAIREGKPVPPEVLKDYPELSTSYLRQQKATNDLTLYRTTRGFAEDAALRDELEGRQGYKLYAVFPAPGDAQQAVSQLIGQDIKFVKHISSPETGEVSTWEVYAKPTEREGRCYELAYRFLRKEEEGEMVHGRIWAGDPPRWIDHAWVETESGFVYEPVASTFYRKDDFYKVTKAEPYHCYTLEQAMVNMLKNNNFGPWETSYLTESPKPTIRIVPYTPKELPPPYVEEYLIQAITPNGEIAGYLGYEDHPDYVRIDIINIEGRYQGQGYSSALLKKLLETAGKKPILTGSLNHDSWRLLRLAQEKGKIRITEPRPEFSRITYYQLEPVR